MANPVDWSTCHHLNGTCPCPKVDQSNFCQYHCCPKCKADKSSQATACPACLGTKKTSKKKKPIQLCVNEEDNLKMLLEAGNMSKDEYDNRMLQLKQKAKKIHERNKTPKSTDEIEGGLCQRLVEGNQHELVYKYSFDYATKKWCKLLMVVSIEQQPFESGAMRVAYHMYDLTKPDEVSHYVAKQSKSKNESIQTYFVDVEMQAMCQYFAEEYNKLGAPKKVEFVEAFLVERFTIPGRPIMACEPYLSGQYVKYSNNYGYVSSDERNSPQSFSHFTHVQSGQKYIVVDIQGVNDRYTDPQVHSWDGKGFGKGNVGQEGIDKFFSTHRCNAICKHLGITDKIVDFKGTKVKTYEPKLEDMTVGYVPNDDDLHFFDLSREQYNYIVKCFKASDLDKSGEISIAELPKLCRSLNVDVPTDRLVEIMRDVDTDGSGEISFAEFIMWWTGHEVKRPS